MAIGRILSCLIPDDPLIPLLNKGGHPTKVVACDSPTLSNVVVPTKPKGSGKLNLEPSSSKLNEELLKKNNELEKQLESIQKSIDKLKIPRSRQQVLDLDSAPLSISITTEPYQERFKIPHLETYDGSNDLDEHLHTYQAIMKIQSAIDAIMCKVFPTTLKSTARRWYHKLPWQSVNYFPQLVTLFSNKFASQREIKHTAIELMQVHQKEGESLRDYIPGRFLDDLLENPPKSWNEVNDRNPTPSSLAKPPMYKITVDLTDKGTRSTVIRTRTKGINTLLSPTKYTEDANLIGEDKGRGLRPRIKRTIESRLHWNTFTLRHNKYDFKWRAFRRLKRPRS
ncbi:hypothetical protein SLEP1_g26386 [Rubroshorea leprosula]|uniref:Retrotransposon gag domain-containing protein n=1 Tax=Rubroshorea leprosula TaxID=152421 RepID=A0AAV5JZB2_9ROSI|nr:hypothetical protein SLEP1_g26386 [Rubroshorea leprosula]